ncbi:hypothetical protein E2C01_102843 [Portunus trituberculatus]|uniref:Uncharacterized protein n=1 Tax=Portunus trituberculatus TaxID=210409 RepID=A0A5B7K995_PORTR|nr:hypothetical protein [Portunus trituberculatus]
MLGSLEWQSQHTDTDVLVRWYGINPRVGRVKGRYFSGVLCLCPGGCRAGPGVGSRVHFRASPGFCAAQRGQLRLGGRM